MPQTKAADTLLTRQADAVLLPTAGLRPRLGGFGFGMHYEPDQTGAGSGGAGAGAGGQAGAGGAAGGQGEGGGEGGAGATKPPAGTLSADAAKQLQRERDRAKTLNRAVFAAMGVNADEVEWETGADGSPVPKVPGLDAVREMVSERRQKDDADADKNKTWAQRKTELQTQHATQTNALKAQHKKDVDGLTAVINRLAVTEPLKAALAAEGAIDDPDGKGNYQELVELLARSLRTTVERDEQSNYGLNVQVMGAEGNPKLDGQGNPVAPRDFVRQWLDARPHHRKPNFRPGSGAGGHGGAGGQGGRPGGGQTIAQQAAAAANALFKGSTPAA